MNVSLSGVDMNWTNVFIAIGIGAVITLAVALVRAAMHSRGSRLDRLMKKGGVTSHGMAPGPGGAELVMLSRSELEDALRKHSGSSTLMSWVQNFVWFSVGTGVSLFSNEIRTAIFG